KSRPVQHHFHSSGFLALIEGQSMESRRKDGCDRVVWREERILLDIRQPGLLAQRAHAGACRFLAGENLEQRGLSTAIWTDQARAVAVRKSQRKILEQYARAKRLAESGTTEQNSHLVPGWHWEGPAGHCTSG